MPDARPLSSLRLGAYDEPPASSSSADRAPQRTASPPLASSRSSAERRLRYSNIRALVDARNTDQSSPRPPRGSSSRRPQSLLGRRRRASGSDRSEDDDRDNENDSSAHDGDGDPSMRSREAKRIRTGSLRNRVPPIKYGYYGQVEPGKLKLELVSCDGGEHRDPRHPATFLGPRNVLRHDKSVYCSKRPSCNLILTHADDTPFCLEKLHVIGPEHGFTAPVQEGVAYIGMTMQDIARYVDPPPHAMRQGSTERPYPRPHRTRATLEQHRSIYERLSLFDALRDPIVDAALDHEGGDRDRRSTISASQHTSRDSSREAVEHTDENGDRDWRSRDHDEPSNISVRRRTATTSRETRRTVSPHPDFHGTVITEDSTGRIVTVVCDDEPGPEENSSPEVRQYRRQRLGRMRRLLELQDLEERLPSPYDAIIRRAGLRQGPPSNNNTLAPMDTLITPPRQDDGEDEEDPAANEIGGLLRPRPAYHTASVPPANATADDEDESSSDGEPPDANVAIAHFRMQSGRHQAAIRFYPPLSGRFILLKLWAGKSNVDVQTVIASGYGGCRFFPAIEMR